MSSPRRTLDTYTLAAYLSGTLSASHQQRVTEQLLADTEARVLLQMAAEALQAAAPGLDEPLPRTKAA